MTLTRNEINAAHNTNVAPQRALDSRGLGIARHSNNYRICPELLAGSVGAATNKVKREELPMQYETLR